MPLLLRPLPDIKDDKPSAHACIDYTYPTGLAANSIVTTPPYIVGSKSLKVYFNGVHAKEGSSKATAFYQEVGQNNTESTSIKMFETLPSESELTVQVI
jgi:hypothetical protein